jgi:hypothetical protein
VFDSCVNLNLSSVQMVPKFVAIPYIAAVPDPASEPTTPKDSSDMCVSDECDAELKEVKFDCYAGLTSGRMLGPFKCDE